MLNSSFFNVLITTRSPQSINLSCIRTKFIPTYLELDHVPIKFIGKIVIRCSTVNIYYSIHKNRLLVCTGYPTPPAHHFPIPYNTLRWNTFNYMFNFNAPFFFRLWQFPINHFKTELNTNEKEIPRWIEMNEDMKTVKVI